MSTLSIQLPDSLHEHAEKLAQREGIPLDQLIAMGIEKISAVLAEDYLEKRARGASREQYDAALAQVPDIDPEEYDRLLGS